MEKLTDISQLKQGDKFYLITGGGRNVWYEFVCIHPKSKYHIIALENMNPVKLEISTIKAAPFYCGEFDYMEAARIRLRILQELVKSLSNMLLSEEHPS